MHSIGESAVELLKELISIDSVNPGLVPGAAGESAIVAYMQERLSSAGFTTEVVTPPHAPDRPSLLAIAPGPDDWPAVVLNGHVDTVGVEGMAAPFSPRIEGNKLFGRGAADMKGGVAGIVAAAATAQTGARRPTGSPASTASAGGSLATDSTATPTAEEVIAKKPTAKKATAKKATAKKSATKKSTAKKSTAKKSTAKKSASKAAAKKTTTTAASPDAPSASSAPDSSSESKG